MSVYVNRTLNMKKIKAIGLDMDYTLVRYNTEKFEQFVHELVLKKLVELKNYPKEILNFKFQFNLVIQGLIIDKIHGNLLQVSRYGKVKIARHGTKEMKYEDQKKLYKNNVIDLSSDNFQSLDTNFSISNGILYSQLVDFKEEKGNLPDFFTIASDVRFVIDIAHSDGSLKGHAIRNIGKYMIQDPDVSKLLERFKRFNKKLILATNSEWDWTKKLMEYSIDPFLKEHKSWMDLFDISICFCSKPNFFMNKNMFLKIDPDTGTMTNLQGKLINGIYQGGWAGKLQDDLGLSGDEILYLGDHIFGDVLSLKKTFNWRTALVLDPLAEEIESISNAIPIQGRIDKLMEEKILLEKSLNVIELKKHKLDKEVKKENLDQTYVKIDQIDSEISDLLVEFKKMFNPHWGEMMRAGYEESRFADQVEKYACIYMAKFTDLLNYTPRTYFRPKKRIMAHENIIKI